MPSLSELQHRFAETVSAAGETLPELADAYGPRGAEGMAVYRRTIASNYRGAMSATYPVLRRIVGESFLHAAIDAYVHAHPSRSGDLNEYGDAFGAFLVRYPPSTELPYLPDVARLEWEIDEANRAADSHHSPDSVLGALSALAAQDLPGLRFRIEPSCRFVASTFPLLQIWQVNQADYDGDLRVDFTRGPHHLRIRREPVGGDTKGSNSTRCEPTGIAIERLQPGEFSWLSALAAGATLAGAIEQALAVDAHFDLQAALHTFIGDGSIAGIGEDITAGIGDGTTAGRNAHATGGIGDAI